MDKNANDISMIVVNMGDTTDKKKNVYQKH